MSAFGFIITLFLLMATVNGLVRLPLKRVSLPNRGMQTVQSRNGVEVVLHNNRNTAYTATIQLGDDPQPFEVQIDTGSSTLVVPSTSCVYCGSHRRFQCTNVNLYQYPTKVSYGTGFGRGYICTDNVKIAGLTVKNQKFTVLNSEDSLLMHDTFDGILGMGFKDEAFYYADVQTKCETYLGVEICEPVHMKRPTPLFQNLIEQNALEENVFSLYLSSSDGKENELTLGGSDPNHYSGNLTYAYLDRGQHEWVVRMDGFHIGDKDAGHCGSTPCNIVVDSGTTLLGIPTSLMSTILPILQEFAPVQVQSFPFGTNSIAYDLLILGHADVSSFKSIYINIKDQTYEIKPSDYVLSYPGYQQLGLTFTPEDEWILGDVFLRNVYTQFDMGNRRIGFAHSK